MLWNLYYNIYIMSHTLLIFFNPLFKIWRTTHSCLHFICVSFDMFAKKKYRSQLVYHHNNYHYHHQHHHHHHHSFIWNIFMEVECLCSCTAEDITQINNDNCFQSIYSINSLRIRKMWSWNNFYRICIVLQMFNFMTLQKNWMDFRYE